jgi:hypothetical protein
VIGADDEGRAGTGVVDDLADVPVLELVVAIDGGTEEGRVARGHARHQRRAIAHQEMEMVSGPS